MFSIKCRDLTGVDCDNVTEGATKEETKSKFYQHGAESPVHAQKYKTATEEEKKAFGVKVDEHLNAQG